MCGLRSGLCSVGRERDNGGLGGAEPGDPLPQDSQRGKGLWGGQGSRGMGSVGVGHLGAESGGPGWSPRHGRRQRQRRGPGVGGTPATLAHICDAVCLRTWGLEHSLGELFPEMVDLINPQSPSRGSGYDDSGRRAETGPLGRRPSAGWSDHDLSSLQEQGPHRRYKAIRSLTVLSGHLVSHVSLVVYTHLPLRVSPMLCVSL